MVQISHLLMKRANSQTAFTGFTQNYPLVPSPRVEGVAERTTYRVAA